MRKMSHRIGLGFFLVSLLAAVVPVNHGGAAGPSAEPAVEAGFYVSYALTRDGRLYAWGANFHGQLANGTFTTNEPYGSSVPLLVPLPGGGATAWSVVQAGSSHTLALANNGNLYSWGTSHAGELGTGHELVTRSDVEVPKPAGVTRWRAIAAGQEHSVALGDNGQLYAWGDNFYGQLGNGNHMSRPAPTPVLLPEGVTHWTEVWAGAGASTFARGNDGKVYGWGRNSQGELGIGTVTSESPFGISSPVAVLLPAGVTGWRSLSAGRYHTLALDEQGQLYGWGSNEQGGLGYQITGIQSTPIALSAPAGVASWRTLSASEGHNLAISADGRLFSWGFAAGNGSHTPAVIFSSRTNWSGIAAGVAHNVALSSDCGLYAWGWQYYGSLGNDNPQGRSYPTPEVVRELPSLCDSPPGTRELHVVGVHTGAGSTTTYQRGDASVWVDRPQKRVILFLSSYSPVRWYINVSVGTILERVILGGYYRQTVEGVGPETEVIPAWFTSSGVYTATGSSLEESAFYEARPRLCAMTGLDISSFHGSPVAPYPTPFIIDRIQDDERLRCDYPQPTPASELPPLSFRIAFHNQSPTGSVVFQNYTLAGPQDGERLLPAMRVVPDAGGRYYYGTENHQVWKADSQAGTAQPMILPATVPTLSWPMGLAFDSQRNRVLLVSLGGEGYLYAYSPPSNQWSVVRNMANLDLDSLEYDPAADVLYSLSVNGSGGRALAYRLSPQGAILAEIFLPFIPIRFGPGSYRSELVSVGEYLVLLLEPTYLYPSDTSVQESRIYLIDPRSGETWLTYRRAYLPENKRPTVQVVWPAEGMVFPAGTTVPLRADASDPDGIVDTVEFFANGANLGRGRRAADSSTTFQLDWPNPLPGSYAITARATDAVGLSTVSSAVHASIREGEPPPPVSERELHAVGISSGVNADGTPQTSNGQGHAGVAVNRPGKPVTLFLSSHGPVLWHVATSNGTTIEKVILGGYYAQAITGVSSNVPVERAYYDGQNGDYLDIGWTMESSDFYRTVQRLCQRTGLDLSSFHGEANPPYPAPFVIDSVQNDARLRCDYPRPVDPSHLPNLSFRLAWNTRNNGAILFRDYSLTGPVNGSHLRAGYRVVTDAGGRYYYGAEQHEIWRVDSQTSTVQEMTLPPTLPELSWPMGIAFDSRRNRVLAVTLVGEGFLYAYSPAEDQWSLAGSMNNRDVDCLVYHAADDSLYAVTQAYEGAASLLRLNASGELQSEIRLPVQPFRVGHGESLTELASVGDYLVLLLETDSYFAYLYPGVQAESRMYLIDPRTGQVSLTYRRILFPDQDDDGVPDDRDQCPNTAAGAVVDANGCSAAQRDTDRDGVPDSIDECPDTPLTARVDSRGCPLPDRCPRLIQWQAGFGTALQDNPRHIYATADGGYVLGGATYSNTNVHDFWIVRVDASGNKLWEKRIGGTDAEHFGDLKPLSDGGFIVGGARNRDDDYEFLLVRLDGNGNVLWERTYGSTRLDFITSLDITADGGFILGGQSDSPADARKSAPLHGRYDYWLVRVDANGNKLWDRSFGGTELEWLTKVSSLADGGFLAVGSSDSGANGNKTSANFGQNDAWVVRLDAQGNKIWERAIGGSGTEWLTSGLVLANGFLVVGQSGSPPSGNKASAHFGGGDAWVVRLDANGSVLWDGSYGGFGSDNASAVAALEDGGFLLGASSSSVVSGNKSWPLLTSQDVWIVGIGAGGEKLWDRAFGGGNPAASWLADLIQTADEGLLIASESYGGIGGDKTVPNFGGADAWLFKLPPLDRDCDGDGVRDIQDFCPDTPAGASVDARGCSASQRDSDGDGVTDDRDQCPGTPPEVQQVDANGCSISSPICAPPIQWQETYARDEFQHAQAAKQLPDGGYLVLGSVQGINGIGTNAGFGNTDAYVLRIDADGQKLWDRIFGGSSEDSLSAMALLPDGGAVLAGHSASPADGNKTSPLIDGADGWLVRIDANGNKIWDKTFSAGEETFFRDIQRLPDGGFVLVGSANDFDDVGWVLRLDANGEQLWERQIYHEENSWFNRVLVLPNGDFLAGGAHEDDDGQFSFWLARLDSGGEILWERFYGGSGEEELTALLAVDGGFLLGGRSASPADGSKTSPSFGSVDYWIVGVDNGGNQLWDASFGGNGEDYLTDVVAMPNGDFVLGGWSSFSSGGNKRSPVLGQSDYWIVRVDASGQKIWDAAYGGDQGDTLLDLEATSGGGLLLSGSSASNLSGNKTAPRRGLGDAWLVKLDGRNGCDLDGDGVPNDRDQCADTAPGTVVDANGCPARPVAAINDQLNPAVASDGTNFLVVWWDRRNADSTEFDIYGARVSATGEVLDPLGIPICTARDYQLYPAVAFDGQNYLVVWTDSRDNSIQPYSLELYGARVTPGGVVLEPDGFRITHGEVALNPTVTFNGVEHLVVAYAREHNGDAGSTLIGVRVTPAGQVRDMEELILREPQGPEYPVGVASLDRDWLAVLNLGGVGADSVRVSRNGHVSSPVRVLNDGNTWFQSLAAAGSNYFLASVVDRQIGPDTHVLDVFGTWITPDGRPRNTVLIAANTNQIIGSHVQPTTYVQINPAVAANGGGVMVIWEAGSIYTNGGHFRFLSDIRGAKVSASGAVSPVISVCSAPQDQSYSAIAFNGQHFLTAWQDARTAPPEDYSPFNHFDIYGARLATAGPVIEPNGFLISGAGATPSDDDNDGVPNDRDQCPNTPPGTAVDANGCPRPNQVCAPAIEWQAGLGDENYQRFHRVHNHAEGGYILGGQNFGRGQMWVVRLLPNGSSAWERFYEGHLTDMQPTADGGYIIAGTARSAGNNTQAQLLRIDANGDVLWSRNYGGEGLEIFESARQTSDGGFIAAGISWSAPGANKTSPHFGQGDAWIVKVDAEGNKIWERSYGGTGLDGAGTTLPTPDGGYVLSVGSDSPTSGNKSLTGFGGFDSWVLKLDSNGDKVWERVFGTTNHDSLALIDVLPGGAFVLSGYASSPAGGNKTSPSYGGSDGWVLMVDADGERIWDRTFGGTDSDGLFTGRRVAGGGFILSGWSQSPPGGNKTSRKVGGQDMWLVRIDSAGNLLWERSIGGGNPYGSSANDVEPTLDGGFITAGETFNDIGGDKTVPWLGSGDGWVVKLRSESDSCDDDNDGVPNDRDQCPNTPAGAVVNAQGCSIVQLCPCDGPWRNHSEYVQCVMEHAWEFYRQGLIGENERKAITRTATRSDCGRRHDRESARIHLCPQTSEECQRDGIRVVLSGDVAGEHIIESSTDLINWSPVEAGKVTVIGEEILFPVTRNVAARFYRVRIQ